MHLLDHSPRIDCATAVEFAEKEYGIHSSATLLPSERDQNFLLTTDSGEQFVLKISNALEDRSLLEAQNAILSYLGSRFNFCQRIVKTVAGTELTLIGQHFVRMVNFIPGTPLGKVRTLTNVLLRDLGRKLGQLDRALVDFDHPASHRNFHWDLQNAPDIIQQYAPLIGSPHLRDIVYRCRENLRHNHSLTDLRRSVIHGDANDYNIIVAGDEVVGLIDFGDVVHSYTVADLAIALAYVVLDKQEPLRVAAEVVAGYNEEFPLTDVEFSLLFDLMSLRLCMSVCHAAHQRQAQPDNDYLNISQAGVERALLELSSIEREVAMNALRIG